MKTILKDLDTVLFYFFDGRGKASLLDLEKNNQTYYLELIEKVFNDGYISKDTPKGDMYSLKVEGRIFALNGGYTTKALVDANAALLVQMEINRREAQDINLQGLSSRLNRWTLGLLIATGVLALIEIIKFLCDIDPCIKEFFERLF